MGEIKTTTIRLSEETIKSFREMAESKGLTQEQCLSNLIHVFELQQAKGVLSDRKKEIEVFEEYISRIQNLYLTSLEINITGEEKIQKEINDKLSEKDSLILSLNKEIKELKDKNFKIQSELNELNESLKKKDIALKSYDELHAQNKFLLNNLAKENETLSVKLQEIDHLHTQIKEYQKLNEELKIQANDYSTIVIQKDLLINSLNEKIDFLESNLKTYKNDIDGIKSDARNETKRIRDEFTQDRLSAVNAVKVDLERYYELKVNTEIKSATLEKDNEINKLLLEIEKLKKKSK